MEIDDHNEILVQDHLDHCEGESSWHLEPITSSSASPTKGCCNESCEYLEGVVSERLIMELGFLVASLQTLNKEQWRHSLTLCDTPTFNVLTCRSDKPCLNVDRAGWDMKYTFFIFYGYLSKSL